jgi:transposase
MNPNHSALSAVRGMHDQSPGPPGQQRESVRRSIPSRKQSMALRKLEHQSQGHDRRYAFKLYPTAEQDKVLCEQATMCAQLWNALLEMCERRYREAVQVQFFHHWRAPEGTVWVFGPGGRERDNQLIASGWKKIGVKKTRTFHCPECAARSAGGKTILCEAHKMPKNFDFGYWIGTPSSGEKTLPEGHLLRDCPEWRKLSTWTPRRVGNSLAMAFAAFFRKDGRAGYPRYKSTRRDLSIPHRAVSGCMVAKSPRHDHSYQLRLRGVPGLVWARGRFPGGIVKYTDVDIKFDGIDWWASVACVINFDDPRHRGGGHDSIDIRFDLIDGFALANGELETPPEFVHAAMIEERAQELRSEFDQAWPRGKRLTEAEFTQRSCLCPDGPGNDAVLAAANERRKDLRDIARLRRRAARIRKNALHVWSTRTVRRAASLIVHDPAIKHHLKSPHGDRTDWGAATREVSELNRAVTNYSAGTAVQMLAYKASEAGIKFKKEDDQTPAIAIGAAMVGAGKTLRRASRKLREKSHE